MQLQSRLRWKTGNCLTPDSAEERARSHAKCAYPPPTKETRLGSATPVQRDAGSERAETRSNKRLDRSAQVPRKAKPPASSGEAYDPVPRSRALKWRETAPCGNP